MLPVQYSGVIAEHMAVRTKAGLFDVSHMGEVYLAGRNALANLQNLMTNDFSRMSDGRVRYSLMCNDRGGIVDDLVVYRQDGERYLVVVNASNRRKDVEWMKARLFKDVWTAFSLFFCYSRQDHVYGELLSFMGSFRKTVIFFGNGAD